MSSFFKKNCNVIAEMKTPDAILPHYRSYTSQRKSYWNLENESDNKWRCFRSYYRKRLIDIYKFTIPEGSRVLEVGCGEGDLLSAVSPSYGVGLDISIVSINKARLKHPHFDFHEMDAQQIEISSTFDYIIFSDLLNELWDVQSFVSSLKKLCHSQTRIVFNLHSNLWQHPRRLASFLGLARSQLVQNWLTPEDIEGLFFLADFELVRCSNEIIWPIRTPIIDSFLNKIVVKFWPFNYFGITNFFVARPLGNMIQAPPVVSVIVPARGESGNISAIFDRIPEMGAGTEIIFVEGGSNDDTYQKIELEMKERNRPMTKLLKQLGKGKNDAVSLGFANATGELLMILDADMTVAPEDLILFYDAWISGKGDFINGSRMVYPMEDKAMRFLNMVGNKLFSFAFSFLLGQKVKDTACGTKVLSKKHYIPIDKNRAYFGNFDRFGDWDLLFGASRFNLKIIDLPIRYYERKYGVTKMQRWRIGVLLVRMVTLGLFRLKFV